MKIYVPIKLHATGGTSSFARKFKQGMEQQGHQVLFDALGKAHRTDYDVLLVSPRASLSLVYQARRQGKKIIHRLDGAYYPATPAGWLFPAYNAPMTAIQYVSHHTVYQSEYARFMCQRLVGPRSRQRSTIIYNGVDTEQFTPLGTHQPLKKSPDELVFFTAQQFRRRDQIEPLVTALRVYQARYHQNTKLVIAGDFSAAAKEILPSLTKNPHIKLLGPIHNNELPSYLRSADTFVYCHPNPACPNNVIEAMACGLPIVGINDGAMSEVMRHEHDGYLVTLPGAGYLRPRPFNAPAFAAAMHAAIIHKSKLGPNARARVLAMFALERMSNAYSDVLTRTSGVRNGA